MFRIELGTHPPAEPLRIQLRRNHRPSCVTQNRYAQPQREFISATTEKLMKVGAVFLTVKQCHSGRQCPTSTACYRLTLRQARHVPCLVADPFAPRDAGMYVHTNFIGSLHSNSRTAGQHRLGKPLPVCYNAILECNGCTTSCYTLNRNLAIKCMRRFSKYAQSTASKFCGKEMNAYGVRFDARYYST